MTGKKAMSVHKLLEIIMENRTRELNTRYVKADYEPEEEIFQCEDVNPWNALNRD